jgi:septal ring factor EnvC (AmiA/AmiB activator)
MVNEMKLFTDLKLNFCIPTASLLLLASFDASAQMVNAEQFNQVRGALAQTQQQVVQLQRQVNGLPNAAGLFAQAQEEMKKRDAQIQQLQRQIGQLEAQVNVLRDRRPPKEQQELPTRTPGPREEVKPARPIDHKGPKQY